MRAWVFNEEQLNQALAALAANGDLAAKVTANQIRAFLYGPDAAAMRVRDLEPAVEPERAPTVLGLGG